LLSPGFAGMPRAPDGERRRSHGEPEPSMHTARWRNALILGCALVVCSSLSARADKIKHPSAVFAGLDKITGRIISFAVAINETVQFGSLQITPRVCFSRPATEAPQTDAFAEVDEVAADKTFHRIFTGWMFADSPGLHGIEHPVYDIWLTDCKGDGPLIRETPDIAEETPPDAPDASAAANPDPNAPNVAKPAQPAPPKKRKPKPATAAITAPTQQNGDAPLDLSGASSSSGRGGVQRRSLPNDSAPIPPANIGQ
jgi:hypothetical protein